jgi:hypothetical protein
MATTYQCDLCGALEKVTKLMPAHESANVQEVCNTCMSRAFEKFASFQDDAVILYRAWLEVNRFNTPRV